MRRTLIAGGVLLLWAAVSGAAELDARAPEARAANQDGKMVELAELYGHRPVVLFFYPKSFTSGCTREVQAFRDAHQRLRQFDAAIFGVSQDDPGTQRRFCDEYKLTYDLLADEGGPVARAFGVPVRDRFSSRWTVVVGRSGKVILVDQEVSADIAGHPDKVLEALQKDWKDYVAGFTPLFNGRDLDGWQAVGAEADTWAVREGILHCTGEPAGYLRTQKAHEDYRLLIEFRYPEKLGRTGVLAHLTGPDQTDPRAIEAVFNVRRMGRLRVHGGATAELGKENPLRQVELAPGEWHRCEIVCERDTITVTLNGQRVNAATKLVPAAGYVGLRSAGVPIQFRTVAKERKRGTKAEGTEAQR